MFMISFGVWDIGYYVALKTMIDFPASLLTWDILFLLPVPWLGPVLAPVIVSVTMIGAGLAVLVEIGRGRRLRARWFHWTAIVLGGLIIIASFCQDYDHTLAGEMPGRFNWVLFGAGEIHTCRCARAQGGVRPDAVICSLRSRKRSTRCCRDQRR